VRGARLGFAARRAAAGLLLLALVPGASWGWTEQEHQRLAQYALNAALLDLGQRDRVIVQAAGETARPGKARGLLDSLGFARACGRAARDDRSQSRYHLPGRTTLEELAAPHNVVAAYLEQHRAALERARQAGGDRPGARSGVLGEALLHEAVAQGYLADAFAAGHLMPPAPISMAGLLPLHRRHVHDYYSSQGVYVINARGDAWQTFGDRLLTWYGPTYAHVLEACVTSLREVLLTWRMSAGDVPAPLGAWADSLARARHTTRERMVASWLASHERPAYLSEVSLPALTLVPMPIVATWSVRTAQRDAHGLRWRHAYPQLADAGGHDPTLDARDVARLPARAAVPSWMVPDSLFTRDPMALVREAPSFASVRYAQPMPLPPRDAGPVLAVGQTRFDDASGGGEDRDASLGYVVFGESPALLHRVSVEGVRMEPLHAGRPGITAVMLAGDLKLPGLGALHGPALRWLENLRLGAGHAWTRGAVPFADGPRYVLGLESPALRIGSSGASLTLRLERQWMRLGHERRGVALDLVIQ